MAFLSVKEASVKWNLSARRIQQLCRSGKLEGAVMQGRSWKIPEDADFPVREKKNPASDRLLPLPVGVSGYIETVTGYYYVDKTLFIKSFVDTRPKVSLFTRPRRFGKTLNMDMLKVFFEKSPDDTSVYFKDRAIWKCGSTYRNMQGKYPVIFLSFKDVKYSEWKQTFKDLAENIRAEYARHSLLMESVQCSSFEKEYYRKIYAGTADEVELSKSLAMLSAMLHKHYGMPAVIIIDEYDTPIQQGYSCGYYENVTGFIRNLFSGAFKDNPHLAFGFMTGILRVAKESIFSGMNNLKVNTIMDDRFSEYFGFTGREVLEMLSYYGKKEKAEEICAWYDGYRFGNSDIFNPWSVINYIDENCFPKAFWQSTGSNEIIGEIIQKASPDITENLRRLLQGETVTTYVDTGVIYPEIHNNPSSIYSFLLMAGYLKNAEIIPQNDGNYICKVSIPNREIRFVYEKEIIARLPAEYGESIAAAIQQALYEKNSVRLQKSIEDYLLQTISSFDASGEAFYQGLMLGFCAVLNNQYAVKSNRESGAGRFDIGLFPFSADLPGFIFELKYTKNEKENLEKLAENALCQIRRKQYQAEMTQAGIHPILCIGIAFCGKRAVIRTESDESSGKNFT